MPEPLPAKISPKQIALDAVLTLAAFLVFYELSKIHVPSEDRVQVGLWSSFTAACLTGVFWIAWQMLKAVYRHQRETRAAPPSAD